MQNDTPLPNTDRLSIISASIMLAFAFTRLVQFTTETFTLASFGIVMSFQINFGTIITVITAILAVAGMDWLIQSHPHKDQFKSYWSHLRHWIIPVLTALVIGVTLNTFATGPVWWVVFVLGSLLLMAVLVAEYIVIAPDNVWHPLATICLTGLSFALYLLLSFAVFSANLRLFFRLPILGIGALMVISRTLYLRLGSWHLFWSLVISLIVSEIVIGFHYLPLLPVQLSLLLVGATYALSSVVTAIIESRKNWAFWGEPVMMFVLMIIVGVIWS